MIRLAILVALSISHALGAGFCAVRVLVTDETGKPSPAQVRLLDNTGSVVREVIARNGSAEFCDFDFGDHTIDVGGGPCTHVLIPGVRVLFGRTQAFRVYLTGCSIMDVQLIGCSTFFRVTGPHGEALAGVSVKSDPAGVVAETDEYGRALVGIDHKESRILVFSKPGFLPIRLSLDCSRPAYGERSITLGAVNQ